jgi:hypothetical protein
MRTVSWFSCGAASAIATKLSNPDVIAYCYTGAEDIDNARFMLDCEDWFGKSITMLKNGKYDSTWDVWEKKSYISGISGAPCTSELKIKPRLEFEKPGDIHIFGYTADYADVVRAESLKENWPDLIIKTPLIEAGLTKSACLSLLKSAGIKPPRTYAMGFPNANCIPCCKATSPSYWALVRKHFPVEFERMNELSTRLGVRLTRLNGERDFISNIPIDFPTTEAIAPDCDFLCQIAEQTIGIA